MDVQLYSLLQVEKILNDLKKFLFNPCFNDDKIILSLLGVLKKQTDIFKNNCKNFKKYRIEYDFLFNNINSFCCLGLLIENYRKTLDSTVIFQFFDEIMECLMCVNRMLKY